jgi:hypothetical protein
MSERRSVPEVMAGWLARLFDLLGARRIFGDSVASIMALPVLERTAHLECQQLAEGADDNRDEDVFGNLDSQTWMRHVANLIWQMLGWAWFVIAAVLVAILAGITWPMGRAGYVISLIGMPAVAASVGTWAVCVGIGGGRPYFERRGPRNWIWLLVAGSWWAFCALIVLAVWSDSTS